jgi:hypothetical protein
MHAACVLLKKRADRASQPAVPSESEECAVYWQSGDVVDVDDRLGLALDDVLSQLGSCGLEPLERDGLVEEVDDGQL